MQEKTWEDTRCQQLKTLPSALPKPSTARSFVAQSSPAPSAPPSNGTTSCSTAPSPGWSSASCSFPNPTRWSATLEAFAVFFIGFVGRPIGAAIFGHCGDRIGRKATLIVTLLVTGIATVAVGLVPTYDSDRHLGRRAADGHPPDPGHRRRRRMGRLGPAGDGMGAHQQEPRLHLGLAAIRRARRTVPRQRRGADLQLALRRPVPRLGLAHSVPAQHHHGRRRPVDPARHSRDAGLPEDPGRGTRRDAPRSGRC